MISCAIRVLLSRRTGWSSGTVVYWTGRTYIAVCSTPPACSIELRSMDLADRSILHCCGLHVLVSDTCPVWMWIVIHQNEISAIAYGETNTSKISMMFRAAVGVPFWTTYRSVFPCMLIPAHTMTEPVSNAYGYFMLSRRSRYMNSSVSEAHTESWSVNEYYWVPVFQGPSDVNMCQFKKCLDVYSRHRNVDCWSSDSHASSMKTVSEYLCSILYPNGIASHFIGRYPYKSTDIALGRH